jgi:hypothetical protein
VRHLAFHRSLGEALKKLVDKGGLAEIIDQFAGSSMRFVRSSTP